MISKHISLLEATHSQTAERKGIKNIPDQKELYAMQLVAQMVFEPLREWYGKPIKISSFYRSPALNKIIGGSANSQHCLGEAIDFICDDMPACFEYIWKHLNFDQIIWEFGDDKNPAWIHVSYSGKRQNRKQVLKAVKVSGKTQYKLL